MIFMFHSTPHQGYPSSKERLSRKRFTSAMSLIKTQLCLTTSRAGRCIFLRLLPMLCFFSGILNTCRDMFSCVCMLFQCDGTIKYFEAREWTKFVICKIHFKHEVVRKADLINYGIHVRRRV